MTASSFTEDREKWDQYQRDHRLYAEFLARRIKDKPPGWRSAPFASLDHDVIDVAYEVHKKDTDE